MITAPGLPLVGAGRAGHDPISWRGRGAAVNRVMSSKRFAEVASLVESGVLNPIVTTLPFERAAEVLAEAQTGHVRGKIVLDLA